MGKWSELKASEKARVIQLAIENGVSDINTIRDTYNIYSSGGQEEILNKVNSSNTNFVQRLKDPNRKSIPDWESPIDRISTHKLSVGTDENGNHYIFPEVQEINGELIDFTRPPYHRFAGEISAEMRGDTVRVPSIEDAIKFTEVYKQYYPFNNGDNLTHKKSTGGLLYPFSFNKQTPAVRYDEGGGFRDWDDYLAGQLINHVENSDSIGWNPIDRTWEHPTLPGYDKNQIGMGVDKNQTEGYSEAIKHRRNGTPYMTELDERRLRHAAIEKANTSANARYKYAQKAVNRPNGTISKIKDAAVVSAIYNLGPGFVARGLFEDKDFMLKLFDGTDKEVIDRINQEYKKKGRLERIEKTNNFLLK